MGELEGRRPAAWRFVRAVVRAQRRGVTGAVLSGLLWQAGAVAAPLVVKYAIDHGIVPKDHHALVVCHECRCTSRERSAVNWLLHGNAR